MLFVFRAHCERTAFIILYQTYSQLRITSKSSERTASFFKRKDLEKKAGDVTISTYTKKFNKIKTLFLDDMMIYILIAITNFPITLYVFFSYVYKSCSEPVGK